jgi:hypothetical protein
VNCSSLILKKRRRKKIIFITVLGCEPFFTGSEKKRKKKDHFHNRSGIHVNPFFTDSEKKNEINLTNVFSVAARHGASKCSADTKTH